MDEIMQNKGGHPPEIFYNGSQVLLTVVSKTMQSKTTEMGSTALGKMVPQYS